MWINICHSDDLNQYCILAQVERHNILVDGKNAALNINKEPQGKK